MSTDRDLMPIVHAWLEQRGQGLTDPHGGFDRFLELVEETPQVRRRWWETGQPSASTRTTRRSRPMFSATRLIAAVAIVALGTGALYFAASPGPSPAVSPSPSPVPWTPPPGLVTQEVAPGIKLVTDDGAGNPLRFTWRDGSAADFAFAPDGSIWLLDRTGLIRVGRAERYPMPAATESFRDLTAAPDGTLWTLSGGSLDSFRDGAWVDAPAFPGEAAALEILPDGTVWARSPAILARLDGDSWTAFPIEDDQGPSPIYQPIFPGNLASLPDGSLWVTVCDSRVGRARSSDGREAVLRFDGQTWHTDSPRMTDQRCVVALAAGLGGELWATVADRPGALARRDGTGWEVSAGDAGIPGVAGSNWLVGTMAVGHDGRLWGTGYGNAGNVLGVYDGTAWIDVYGPDPDTTLLEHPLKVAPDGSIWLLTDDGFIVVDTAVAAVDP